MPPRNVADRLTDSVGKTVGASIQIRCYGGGAGSKCYADYVDFYLDGKLIKEGKIAPIEYSSNGRLLLEYYFSFKVSFDLTISSIEDKLMKRVVHFKLEKHSVRLVYYYRGVEVETAEYTTTFFPESFAVKKGYDPIIQEFLSTVSGEGLVYRPNDSNLKRAYKAVGA